MPQMDLLGWIVVGFIAGALSGMVFKDRTASGCLPTLLIGILGGILGGFLAQQVLGLSQTVGFIGAVVVAFVGAVIVRWVIGLSNRR